MPSCTDWRKTVGRIPGPFRRPLRPSEKYRIRKTMPTTADRRNRTSCPIPPNVRIFRPISQQQSTYPAKLPNVQQKHPTAAFRANPKHCGVAAGFPAKAAMWQNLCSNRSSIHHPGLRNTIGRPFRRPLRYKQIKNRSFAGSTIGGTMSAIPKTIIPPP